MTSPDLRPNRRPLAAGIALVVAAVLVLLSMMVVVPPFTMALFPFAVGAAEMSPFLVLFDLLWCLPANRMLRGQSNGVRYATLALLAASACVAVWPLTQFNRTVANASAQLGDEDARQTFSLLTALRGLPTNADVVERTIPYVATDGAPLSLRLYSLPAKAVRPTVVVIYGGAWRAGGPTQCANVSRALAAHGFTVAAIDYRHAPRARFPAQTDDVIHSLALLRDSAAAWGVDPAHMALLGRSAGGHLAEMAAFAPNGFPVQAVIAIYAPQNLVQGYMDLPTPDPIDVREVLRGFTGGTPDDRLKLYRAASPSSYVRSGLPPTLLIFGGRDHIVKPAFNREAAAALRAAHVPVVEVELPWAEHGFDLAPSGLGAQLAFGVIVEFLDRQLRPKRA